MAERPGPRQRGYSRTWQLAALEFLAEHPFCACGCGRRADMVDHIVPHRGRRDLFWSRANWQALASSPCHARAKQRAENRGGKPVVIGCAPDGTPLDPNHPWNRASNLR
jgi:5-methylcytosine-specific restriction endonuclease McrA